jgi:hypothetical protein
LLGWRAVERCGSTAMASDPRSPKSPARPHPLCSISLPIVSRDTTMKPSFGAGPAKALATSTYLGCGGGWSGLDVCRPPLARAVPGVRQRRHRDPDCSPREGPAIRRHTATEARALDEEAMPERPEHNPYASERAGRGHEATGGGDRDHRGGVLGLLVKTYVG